MELKLAWRFPVQLAHHSLNRTTLELKQYARRVVRWATRSLNRTTLELKLSLMPSATPRVRASQSHHFGIETAEANNLLAAEYALNRTTLELKHLGDNYEKMSGLMLSIAPLWN